jgi:hypothetical protein
MKLPSRKQTESLSAQKNRLILLVVSTFFLGSAICPFNPPVGGELSTKQGEIMNHSTQSAVKKEMEEKNLPVSEAGELQTATFALG